VNNIYILTKQKTKSKLGFEKWTFLKMSKNEKPKYFIKKSYFVTIIKN
jgi:hypothetical protein